MAKEYLFIGLTLAAAILAGVSLACDGIVGDDDDDDTDGGDDDDDDDRRGCDELLVEFPTCYELFVHMVDCGVTGRDLGYSSLDAALEDCETHYNCDLFMCIDGTYENRCQEWDDNFDDCGMDWGCDLEYSTDCNELVDNLDDCGLSASALGFDSWDAVEDYCEASEGCNTFRCLDSAWANTYEAFECREEVYNCL